MPAALEQTWIPRIEQHVLFAYALMIRMHYTTIRVLLLLGVPSLMQGCASFYLHDAATQTATDSARSALDAVKLDAIFDSQSNYLDQLEKDETAAVTVKYAAQRDQDILQFLDGTGPDGDDGLTTLQQRIDGYLVTLVGVSDRGCPSKLWRALKDSNPVDASASLSKLTAFSSLLSRARTDSQANCKVARFAALPPPATNSPLDTGIGTLKADLTAAQALQDRANAEKEVLKAQISKAEASLSGATADADALNKALNQLKADLTDANPLIRQFASEQLSTRVAATIDALNPEGTQKDSSSTAQARSGIAVLHALAGVGDAFASPPRIPHPNALAATQSWLNYVGSRAADELQNQQTLLRDHQAQLAASVAAVYFLSKAGEEAEKINGVYELPGIGKVRCPADATASPKILDIVSHLCGTQGLSNLIDASDGTATRAIDGALLYYASAWTRGFTPNEILSRRGYIDQRRIKLASSRAAGAAWMGTLKPSVETLASYGSGGFDPQVLAQLLQALGVAGIAAGVNR